MPTSETTVVEQELTGKERREALSLHETRVVATELELEQIEERLPTADVDEADDLLKRRRELEDKLEWLNARTGELQRRAVAEETREKMARANAGWAPLAQQRQGLIDELDVKINELQQMFGTVRREFPPTGWPVV